MSLLLGIAAIVWGTRLTLDNAVRIATHYQLSDFFIGVAILAIGSDLPEIVVSVAAALHQLNGSEAANLIVGNALGSCLGQFGLVMAIAGLLGQLSLPRTQVLFHGGVLFGSMLLLALVGWSGDVNRIEGAVLVAVFASYLVLLVVNEGALGKARDAVDGGMFRIWCWLLLGLVTVVVSAEVIVDTALQLARAWGIDQSFIGIAIIGVGTSLPELMISIGAALRARMALSVGNLIGSNILDVLLPIGIAAVIVPISFDPGLLRFDLVALLLLSLVVLGMLLKPRGIRRPQALLILLCYLGYLLSFTQRL